MAIPIGPSDFCDTPAGTQRPVQAVLSVHAVRHEPPPESNDAQVVTLHRASDSRSFATNLPSPGVDASISAIQLPSPVLVNAYPPRLQQPVVIGPAQGNGSPVQDTTSHLARQQRTSSRPAQVFAMIAFSGTTCTSIASIALQTGTPATPILDACAVCGIAGTIFAVAAGLASVKDVYDVTKRLLWASSACAVPPVNAEGYQTR
ncbi:unnamed protein product [Peniophora sp. CBMAI 1063]|nr:unnamed protein product [Peniophora sp. CBMAI 1063]